MTIDEAIHYLSVHSSTNGSGLCTDKQHYEAKQMAIKAIEQTIWIPCNKRLPKKDGRYYVTRHDYVTQTDFADLLWYEKGMWWNRQATGDYAVIAWMPLLKPYKAESEDIL